MPEKDFKGMHEAVSPHMEFAWQDGRIEDLLLDPNEVVWLEGNETGIGRMLRAKHKGPPFIETGVWKYRTYDEEEFLRDFVTAEGEAKVLEKIKEGEWFCHPTTPYCDYALQEDSGGNHDHTEDCSCLRFKWGYRCYDCMTTYVNKSYLLLKKKRNPRERLTEKIGPISYPEITPEQREKIDYRFNNYHPPSWWPET